MNQKWDAVSSYGKMQEWHRQWLTQVYRILKPGGVIKSFSATRTYHRLMAAMEEVGFQDLRVQGWCYAQGFPKSLDVSKALDKLAGKEPEVVGTKPVSDLAIIYQGYGTGLKPSWESIVCGYKPLLKR